MQTNTKVERKKYQENVRYVQYSEHTHFIILFDKLEKTYAIHSKDPNNDIGLIANFEFASDAIAFAESRIVTLEKKSTEK